MDDHRLKRRPRIVDTHHNTQRGRYQGPQRLRDQGGQDANGHEHQDPRQLHGLRREWVHDDHVQQAEEHRGRRARHHQRGVVGLEAVPAVEVFALNKEHFRWIWNK